MITQGNLTDLKPSDDQQGVDVVDPELLSDLLQMFSRKRSNMWTMGGKQHNIQLILLGVKKVSK